MKTIANTIDYTKLYRLRDTFTTGIIRIEPCDNWIDRPKALAMFKGEYMPEEPIVFRTFMGSRIADFLWSGLPPLVCVSKKVTDLLLSHNFTGWSTYPAKVTDKNGELLPGYSGLVIKSNVGFQDVRRSPLITKPPIVPKGVPYNIYKGMYFDESKWDGSDIFRIEHGFIIITQSVRKAFKKEKITNAGIDPLLEVEMDENIFKYANKDD